MESQSPEVVFDFPRGVDDSIAYQKYFLMALEDVARLSVRGEPWPSRLMRRYDSKVALLATLAQRRRSVRRRLPLPPRASVSGHVGRYEATVDGRRVRFAIDAHDGRAVADDGALEWADVYFKSNYWPSDRYDQKVRPLVNGNGVLDRRGIERLRSLREAERDLDLVYVSNLWGGREHGVRVFEQLARLDVRSTLIAVFPWGFDPVETDEFKARLHAVGVPTRDEPLPLGELWGLFSRSKVVFFRSGKHLCLPWRTLDLLAIGACVVFDSRPFPQWYVPLEADVNYVSCGIPRPEDTSPAAEEDYERIGPAVAGVLADVDRMDAIRRANATYFDRHAAPAAIGRQILRALADA